MSKLASKWADEQAVGNGVAKAVLRALAWKHWNGTRVEMPISELVDKVEFRRTAVIDALRYLERSGYIATMRTGRYSVYELLMSARRTSDVRRSNLKSGPHTSKQDSQGRDMEPSNYRVEGPLGTYSVE